MKMYLTMSRVSQVLSFAGKAKTQLNLFSKKKKKKVSLKTRFNSPLVYVIKTNLIYYFLQLTLQALLT